MPIRDPTSGIEAYKLITSPFPKAAAASPVDPDKAPGLELARTFDQAWPPTR
jgi:hypothetical protein